jgi:drug/metabolite transporter (DMT)-like permease
VARVTVILSLLTALGWTAANYWFVPLSRSVDPYMATFLILLGSGICTLPLALGVDGVPGHGDLRSLALAAGAGIFEVGGFVFFFRALERGDLAVVAPIIGLSGGLTAIIVFAFGEHIGALVGLALAVALCGGCLAAAAGGKRTAAGALPAFGSAVCLGLMYALYAAADDLGAATVVATGRISAVVLLSVLVVWRRERLPGRGVVLRLLWLGALDAGAFVCYALAAERGPVSVAAVVAGQFATLSAVAGIIFLHERLRPHQYAGIALAGIGTTVLALAH